MKYLKVASLFKYTTYAIKDQSGTDMNFCLCDTRGMEELNGLHHDDCKYLLDGNIKDHYEVLLLCNWQKTFYKIIECSFKIPFYLVPPIVYSFRAQAFYYLGTICRFSWTCHIEGPIITAVKTYLGIFLNSTFYHCKLKCWILLKPVLGTLTVVCTWQHRPWTGSIKPSLQHFQFCRFGLSVGNLVFSILSPHQRCFCGVEAVKNCPVHSIRHVWSL
jgi:hypothetical protein